MLGPFSRVLNREFDARLGSKEPQRPAEIGVLALLDEREERPALATGEVLGLVKALGRQVAQGAEQATPVLAKEPVGIIFDHGEAVTSGQHQNGIHLAADTGVVHGHNGPGAARDLGFEQALVEVEGVRANVNKDGPGPAQHKRIGRRDKRKRGHYHVIARFDVE